MRPQGAKQLPISIGISSLLQQPTQLLYLNRQNQLQHSIRLSISTLRQSRGHVTILSLPYCLQSVYSESVPYFVFSH